MQIKTIEKNIKAKLEQWLETISDEFLRARVKESALVSGGCIASMLLDEPVNDYDVYLQDINVCNDLAAYYTRQFTGITILDGRQRPRLVSTFNEKFEYKGDSGVLPIVQNNAYAISLRNLKSDQIKLFFEGSTGGLRVNEGMAEDKMNYTPMYFSPNAISLSNNLQIVLRFWGHPARIHATFDFIHATNYFTFSEGVVRNLPAIESILTRQLKYQGSHYPVTSIIRVKKFVKRGFNISAGEMLKIMFQISMLDLTDPDVLEEQLIGVDVAYFDLIITALRNKIETDKNFKLSATYLNELIDRIFNEGSDL